MVIRRITSWIRQRVSFERAAARRAAVRAAVVRRLPVTPSRARAAVRRAVVRTRVVRAVRPAVRPAVRRVREAREFVAMPAEVRRAQIAAGAERYTARQAAKATEMSELSREWYEKAAGVAEAIRKAERPAEIGMIAAVPTVPKPVRRLAVGVGIKGPAAIIEMAGMVPGGVEMMARRPEIIPAAAAVGTYEMGRGIYTGLRTDPFATVGEFVAFGAIARGVGMAARPVTPKIRVYKAPDTRKTVVEVGKYRPIEITKAVKEVRVKKATGEDVMMERVSSYEARLGQLRYAHEVAAIGRLRGGYLLEAPKPKPPRRVELPPTERGLVPTREARLMLEAPKPKPTRIYAEIAKPYVKIADIPLYATKARLAWIEMGVRKLTWGVRGKTWQPSWTRTVTGPGLRVPPSFIPRKPLPKPPTTFEISTTMRQRLAAGEAHISREMRTIQENIIRERIRAEEPHRDVPRKPPVKITRPPIEPIPSAPRVVRPPTAYDLPPTRAPRAPEPLLAPEMPRPARPRVTVAERPPAIEMPFLEPAPARPIPEVRAVSDVVKTITLETKKARTEHVKARQRAEQSMSETRRRGAEMRKKAEEKTKLRFIPFITPEPVPKRRIMEPYREPTEEEKRRPTPYWVPMPVPEPVPAPIPVSYPTPTPIPDIVPTPEPVPTPAPIPEPVPTPYKVPPPPPIDYKRPPPPPPIKIPKPEKDKKKRALRKRRKAEAVWWRIENPVASLSEIMWGRGLPKKK